MTPEDLKEICLLYETASGCNPLRGWRRYRRRWKWRRGMLRRHTVNPYIFSVVRRRSVADAAVSAGGTVPQPGNSIVGFFSLFPLRAEVAERIESEGKTSALAADDIYAARDGVFVDAPAYYLDWGMAQGARAQATVGYFVMTRLREYHARGARVCYTTPRTEAGLKADLRYGFRPANPGLGGGVGKVYEIDITALPQALRAQGATQDLYDDAQSQERDHEKVGLK